MDKKQIIAGRLRAGFSLIETLMVVLIVGILTAVALPQYRRAVEKARYATARRTAATLSRGMDAYYETYKEYTAMMDNLDVSINYKSTKTECTNESDSCNYFFSDGGHCTLRKDGRIYCYTKGNSFFYAIFLPYGSAHQGKTFCFAQKKDISADDWNYKFCQRETGSYTPFGWSTATEYKAFEYVR